MGNTKLVSTAMNRSFLGRVAFQGPEIVYFALSTTTPTEAGTNFTEPSAGGYARVGVENNTFNFIAADSQPPWGQRQANGVTIRFSAAIGKPWGTCTCLGIFDAKVGGNLLWYGVLTQPQAIGVGDQFYLSPQDLGIELG